MKRLQFARRTILLSIAILILAILATFFLKDRFTFQGYLKAPAKSISSTNNSDVNVIFISIDSLRADHLGCYGYFRKTSPNIDRLASEGVVVSNTFTTSPWTLPAHLSMLTSLYSEAHGVISPNDSLDPMRITLAEVLKKEGYHTAAFVSGPFMNSIFGFDQGFDLYNDSINAPDKSARADEHLYSHRAVTSPQLTNSIKAWLSDNHQKKFFLFLHYFDVHYDYVPPHPF